MKEFFGFGGYTRTPEGYFSWQHLTFVTCLMVVMTALAVIFGLHNKNKAAAVKNQVIIWAAILIDSFELFKIVLMCIRASDPLLWKFELPLFLCSIQLIAIPLAAFCKGRMKEAALDFVLIFGLLGAVMGIFFFFSPAIPVIPMYKEAKPEMEWVIPEITLSKQSTG